MEAAPEPQDGRQVTGTTNSSFALGGVGFQVHDASAQLFNAQWARGAPFARADRRLLAASSGPVLPSSEGPKMGAEEFFSKPLESVWLPRRLAPGPRQAPSRAREMRIWRQQQLPPLQLQLAECRPLRLWARHSGPKTDSSS